MALMGIKKVQKKAAFRMKGRWVGLASWFNPVNYSEKLCTRCKFLSTVF